jgi:hypothetical protein
MLDHAKTSMNNFTDAFESTIRDIIVKEFGRLLASCKELGLSEGTVKSKVHTMLEVERLNRLAEYRQSSRRQDLLNAARGWAPPTSEVAGPYFKAACLEWLVEAKGVSLGDVVQVQGWSKPRIILVEEVRLEWPEEGGTASLVEDIRLGWEGKGASAPVFVVLKGPTQIPGEGYVICENRTEVETKMKLVAAPKAMEKQFPEQFAESRKNKQESV